MQSNEAPNNADRAKALAPEVLATTTRYLAAALLACRAEDPAGLTALVEAGAKFEVRLQDVLQKPRIAVRAVMPDGTEIELVHVDLKRLTPVLN